MEKLGVGIIGAGWVAGEHIKAFNAHPQAEIVALCGRNEARTKACAVAANTRCEIFTDHEKMLAQGYKQTTNNRMELRAVIAGLSSLNEKCKVMIYSDSKYIVDAVQKGWAERWQQNGWQRNKKDKALNPDLWEKLLSLLQKHDVDFTWVKGHAGHKENEICDKLAVEVATGSNLKDDNI